MGLLSIAFRYSTSGELVRHRFDDDRNAVLDAFARLQDWLSGPDLVSGPD
jgi:hypothetical protein